MSIKRRLVTLDSYPHYTSDYVEEGYDCPILQKMREDIALLDNIIDSVRPKKEVI